MKYSNLKKIDEEEITELDRDIAKKFLTENKDNPTVTSAIKTTNSKKVTELRDIANRNRTQTYNKDIVDNEDENENRIAINQLNKEKSPNLNMIKSEIINDQIKISTVTVKDKVISELEYVSTKKDKVNINYF
jgi:hypothetical protein